MMKDSTLDTAWLREQMAKNPPSIRPNGEIFTGPVRLSFPNLFKPGNPGTDGGEGKFGAALLFPPGSNMSVFEQAWMAAARAAFPKNWDDQGNPVGLHLPFHDQREKAFAAKPLAGYTPGGIYFSATSKFKPAVVDASCRPITDETKVYPGVWAFVSLNVYHYANRKSGVAFGMQTVMIIADDTKLGGGAADPTKSFGHVQITAQSNIAAKFDGVAGAEKPPATASLMPSGGHTGAAGNLAVQPLPGTAPSLEDMM